MALPTFNSFSFQDSNWITERISGKGFAERGVIRGKVNRREGVKLLATEFGEKEITIEGRVIGSSAANLQTLVDNMKKAVTIEEGDLVLETDRTFKATVTNLEVPDEHYSQSTAPFLVTFVASNPFAEGSQLTAVTPVQSGTTTFSGSIVISGTMFNRPTLVYTPGTPTAGTTNIPRLDLYHVQTGQTITVSGFGSGTKLGYQNAVTINMDDFTSLEGASAIGNSGGFPRWEPGTNTYTLTVVGGNFPGGNVSVIYKPRFL